MVKGGIAISGTELLTEIADELLPGGIGLACIGAVVLLGCGAAVLLRDPVQSGIGISKARAEAVYGFAALLAAVAGAFWVYRAYGLLGGRFDVEQHWPIVIGGLMYAGAAFAASCFVGALTVVLYHAGVEARRARREEQLNAESRRRREAEISERRTSDEKQVRTSRTKRERRIFDMELIYSFHEQQVADRFPKAEFERFVIKYLRPDVSDDEFFERAQQLQAMIDRLAEAAGAPEKTMTLEETSAWYTNRKSEIERLAIDEYYKEDLLTQLNERYTELCQQIMSEVRPV